jgi:hypothetical protein
MVVSHLIRHGFNAIAAVAGTKSRSLASTLVVAYVHRSLVGFLTTMLPPLSSGRGKKYAGGQASQGRAVQN